MKTKCLLAYLLSILAQDVTDMAAIEFRSEDSIIQYHQALFTHYTTWIHACKTAYKDVVQIDGINYPLADFDFIEPLALLTPYATLYYTSEDIYSESFAFKAIADDVDIQEYLIKGLSDENFPAEELALVKAAKVVEPNELASRINGRFRYKKFKISTSNVPKQRGSWKTFIEIPEMYSNSGDYLVAGMSSKGDITAKMAAYVFGMQDFAPDSVRSLMSVKHVRRDLRKWLTDEYISKWFNDAKTSNH
jgi:hypothetical protein